MTVTYKFSTSYCPAHAEIAALWLELQEKCPPNFFLQWSWIGCWLKTFQPRKYHLVVAEYAGEVVGLAILVEQLQWRYGAVRSKQLHLHRTGLAVDDEIWIEYNDFLLATEHANSVRTHLFSYICDTLDFDELVIGAATSNILASFATSKAMTRVDVWQARSYCAVFHDAPEQTFAQHLSANTRYQIKRSLKLFPHSRLEKANDSQSAMAWLDDIAKLHQQRWPDSGFQRPQFVEFHRRVVSEGIAEGRVDLLKINLNESTRVYLYNFIAQKQVYFYLSAISEFAGHVGFDNKAKPGLIAHFMAIEHYKRLGFKCYDFMGGDARYKESFSNEVIELYIAKFQRSSLIFRAENCLKKIKRQLSRKLMRQSVASK